MKKIFLFAFFLLAFTTLNAQDNNSYIELTKEQIKVAKKVSEEKIGAEVSFSQGIDYEGKFFWFVTTKDEKEYYFNSTKTFTDIVHIEESYSSLMEYVIEESGF